MIKKWAQLKIIESQSGMLPSMARGVIHHAFTRHVVHPQEMSRRSHEDMENKCLVGLVNNDLIQELTFVSKFYLTYTVYI